MDALINRGPGLYPERELELISGGAYIWRGLYPEGLIFGGAYIRTGIYPEGLISGGTCKRNKKKNMFACSQIAEETLNDELNEVNKWTLGNFSKYLELMLGFL